MLSVDGGSGFTKLVDEGSVTADIIVPVQLSLVLIQRCTCTNNSSPGGSGFLAFKVSQSLLFTVVRLCRTGTGGGVYDNDQWQFWFMVVLLMAIIVCLGIIV